MHASPCFQVYLLCFVALMMFVHALQAWPRIGWAVEAEPINGNTWWKQSRVGHEPVRPHADALTAGQSAPWPALQGPPCLSLQAYCRLACHLLAMYSSSASGCRAIRQEHSAESATSKHSRYDPSRCDPCLEPVKSEKTYDTTQLLAPQSGLFRHFLK